ncbi:prolactin-releasing peptide receptor-like [Mercenaria mercenaria]|uniref:prolactin-releasing peptide receptor-like n=1 Tax=Mercenaria mercenaria TaxID=6596 RepID=UPI00234EA375|nr:prolactin-releasing peptide receptor-like [Mercenaria mercenaria]
MEHFNGSFSYLDILAKLDLRLQNVSLNTSLFPKVDIYEVPTFVVVLLAILYGCISVIAIIGNGLVIVVIAKDKRMQTVTNIFIANLAFADVIIGVFTIPFQFHPALHQRWDFPDFLCKLAPSVKVLSVSVSVVTLTIISLDRYVAVMYPLKAGFSKGSAVLCLLIIWGLGLGSCFPEGYYYSVHLVLNANVLKFQPYCEAIWPTENFGKYYHFYLLLVQYLFPLLVINLSYIRISCKIWGTKPPGNTVDRGDRDTIRQRNKKKVVKMLIIVVLLFVICWMPLQLYSLISEIHPQINEYKYINIVWFCSNWLAMSNSCYNPFIYGLLNEKFKREYRLMFSKTRCLRKHSAENNSSLFGNDGSNYVNMYSAKRITLTFRPSNSLHGTPCIHHQTPNHRCSRRNGYVTFVARGNAEDSF